MAKKYPPFFCVCMCHASLSPICLLPPPLWQSDVIQRRERWDVLLRQPQGGEVWYLSSLSCQPQWGSHTQGIRFVSQPHLLAFHHSSSTMIRRAKEIRRGCVVVGGNGGREREPEREGEKWEALGWKRSKMNERGKKQKGTWRREKEIYRRWVMTGGRWGDDERTVQRNSVWERQGWKSMSEVGFVCDQHQSVGFAGDLRLPNGRREPRPERTSHSRNTLSGYWRPFSMTQTCKGVLWRFWLWAMLGWYFVLWTHAAGLRTQSCLSRIE